MNKITLIFLIFVGLIFGLESTGFAQGTVSLETEVDKSTITIGDIIRYTLAVTYSPDVRVNMPSPGSNLGQFEIQDYDVQEPQEIDDMLRQASVFQISIYDTGSYTIPPIEIGYQIEGDSTRYTLQSEAVAIRVNSVKPSEAEDIKDIKAPLTVPPDYSFYYYLAGLALLLAIIIVAIFIYMKKFRRVETPFFKPPPPRPEHEIAYEALDRLEKSDLLPNGEIKAYYVEISEIIRAYLARRYEIHVLEMTTTEVMWQLEESQHLKQQHLEMIKDFLDRCDMVKFAKHKPADEHHQKIMQDARKIIDETRRVFIAPPEADETEPVENKTEVAV